MFLLDNPLKIWLIHYVLERYVPSLGEIAANRFLITQLTNSNILKLIPLHEIPDTNKASKIKSQPVDAARR